MRAALRTDHAIYFRCQQCGDLLMRDKPVRMRLSLDHYDALEKRRGPEKR
jgi:hypothetical protein